MAYTIWLILGFLFLIGEMFTGDFTLACIGIGAFVAGLTSYLGINIYWQLGLMAITIFILFFTLRPFVLKYFYKSKHPTASGIDALIGKTFTVVEMRGEKPFIKSDADLWEVKSKETLKKGDSVEVKAVKGITLIVDKK